VEGAAAAGRAAAVVAGPGLRVAGTSAPTRLEVEVPTKGVAELVRARASPQALRVTSRLSGTGLGAGHQLRGCVPLAGLVVLPFAATE
jgi:hypothetical protein